VPFGPAYERKTLDLGWRGGGMRLGATIIKEDHTIFVVVLSISYTPITTPVGK
jgi:hypothetical protein